MKDLLTYIISKIIDYPQDLNIEEQQIGDNIYTYNIICNSQDAGKIIGKEGKIIQSIRNIAKVLAVKENKQIRIEIK